MLKVGDKVEIFLPKEYENYKTTFNDKIKSLKTKKPLVGTIKKIEPDKYTVMFDTHIDEFTHSGNKMYPENNIRWFFTTSEITYIFTAQSSKNLLLIQPKQLEFDF